MKYRAVLFDLDGTLVDSLRDIQNSVNHVLASYGLPALDLETVRSYIGDGLPVLLARAFLGREELPERSPPGTPDRAARRQAIEELLARARQPSRPSQEEARGRFWDHYYEHLLDNTRCYPGVLETLEALRRAGVSMGVVSNKPEKFTEKIVDELGLRTFFGVIVGGDSIAVKKPDPGPVLHALERLDCPASESLMVGDSGNDVESGRRAGCRTAAVTFGFRSRAQLQRYRPDLLLADLRELLDGNER